MPVYAVAKSRGRRTSCISDLLHSFAGLKFLPHKGSVLLCSFFFATRESVQHWKQFRVANATGGVTRVMLSSDRYAWLFVVLIE